MLKKTIKYTDFDGNPREEDFYFNFTEAEAAEMELSTRGGLENTIKQIVNEQDGEKLAALFKGMILGSVGRKSPDGRRFEKSDAIRADFEQTNAYSVLWMELATDAKAGAEFVRGIVPNVQEKKA